MMSDYIEREKALKAVEDIVCDADDAERTCDRIIDIPAADVAPIRHGSWKEDYYGEAGGYTFFNVVCNCCGYDMGEKMTPFCPNCGTKMDGELIRDERIF